MSLGLPKGIHYLKPMRYNGAFIENISYHKPPSIMNNPYGIYDHI